MFDGSARACVIVACREIGRSRSPANRDKARIVNVPPLEMSRRVTRDMAVTSELPVLLQSIASALADHTGASFVRVFLYQTDRECDICRGEGAGEAAGEGMKRLHLHADAGDLRGAFKDNHAL